MTERGRDAICKKLAEVFSHAFVMGATSEVVSQEVRILGSEVAVIITKVRRMGRQTPAGEPLAPRDTRHQRVVFRTGDTWRIVRHLIADARDPVTGRH